MPVPDHHRLRARLDVALDAAFADAASADAASADARAVADEIDGGDGTSTPGPPPMPPLDDAVRTRLVAFVVLLAKWNRVWNLTAVREPLDMLERHVLDSLSLLPFVDAELAGRELVGQEPVGRGDPSAPSRLDLIDVGSGAGLPVLVLAIARPALVCLSVERTTKKARFQRQAALELGLDAVTVRDERVQAVRARASILTSRAFAAPADFLTVAAPLTAPGGAAFVMLGRAERLPAALPGGWSHERTVRTAPPPPAMRAREATSGDSPERHVAVCRRTRIPYDPPP